MIGSGSWNPCFCGATITVIWPDNNTFCHGQLYILRNASWHLIFCSFCCPHFEEKPHIAAFWGQGSESFRLCERIQQLFLGKQCILAKQQLWIFLYTVPFFEIGLSIPVLTASRHLVIFKIHLWETEWTESFRGSTGLSFALLRDLCHPWFLHSSHNK